MRNRLLSLIALLMVATLVVACSAAAPAAPAAAPAADAAAEATEAPAEEAAAAADAFTVAIVMPSTINDMSWSQSIFDSLNAIKDEMGAEAFDFVYSENLWNVTDAASALRDYADQGYDLVIAHGTQYGTTLFELAPDYPETSFAWGTANDAGVNEGLTNIFAFDPRSEEGAYVLGVVGAMLSEAKNVGVVGPIDAGDAKLHVDGFVAGVNAVDPDINIGIVFTGGFGDTALAAEAANTLINAGADVLTGSAQQVAGAIGVAAEKSIPWLGTQGDQSPLAPDLVMATDLYDWAPTIKSIIDLRAEGTLGGIVFELTLENGGQTMVYHESLPEEILEAALAAEAAVIAGEVEIPAERQLP